ncbi:MAG: 16S rRNA (guanine(966)-N(2))-methyltransferase RsmD [Chloroflexi bacterium]|nr:16S rRNA (guanine(966)-N(2))-methyltransferase RsmD [Chloroflexota bacterium]
MSRARPSSPAQRARDRAVLEAEETASATRRAAPPTAGRVIAGTARGIRLAAPGPGTRPLGDRVKEALFAILEPRLPDAVVLDLFAGSGAAGIEALSRRARRATFVERNGDVVRTLRANLERTHLAPGATVVREDALAWLDGGAGRAGSDGPFDVVVLDPPYEREDLLAGALERLARPGVLAPDAIVVAKHGRRATPPERIGLLASDRERRFGETVLTFYRVAAPDEEDA